MDVTVPNSHATKARVLIADDHLLVAEGIERLLLESFDLIGFARDGQQLVSAVVETAPDVVITDIGMPRVSGLQALHVLREQGNRSRFVILTMHDEPALACEAFRLGASAYVLKTAAGAELVCALRAVLDGGSYVTPSLGARLVSGGASGHAVNLTGKQLEVLALVAKGLRSKQVADKLGISIRTVESHKYTMMQLLDAHSAVELVRKAELAGLLPAVATAP